MNGKVRKNARRDRFAPPAPEVVVRQYCRDVGFLLRCRKDPRARGEKSLFQWDTLWGDLRARQPVVQAWVLAPPL